MSKYRIRPYQSIDFMGNVVFGFIVQRRSFLIWWDDVCYYRTLEHAGLRLADLKKMEAMK